VLFCDLVAFTAWSEQGDQEDVGGILRRHHESIMRPA